MKKEKKSMPGRVQVNGKAGMGRTTNMSGLAKLDEALREVGINVKVNFTGAKPKKKK